MENPVFDERPKAVDILVYAGDSFAFRVAFVDKTPGGRFKWEAQVRGSAGDGIPDASFDFVDHPDGMLVSLSPATTRKLWSLRAAIPKQEDFFYSPSDHLENADPAKPAPTLLHNLSSRGKQPDLPAKVKSIDQYLALTPCGSEAFEVDREVIGPLPPDWLPDVGLPTYPGILARTSVLNHNYLGVWDVQITDKAHGTTVTVVRGRILVVSDVTRSEHQIPAEGTGYIQGPQGEQGLQGVRGLKGARGLIGSAGAPGSSAPGTPGPPGTDGTPGAKGNPGVKGDPGTNGTPGVKGDPGDPGVKGDPGTNGTPGVKGDPGDPGVKGDPGTPGTNGTPGAKGDPGDKGDPGTNGTAGADGITEIKAAAAAAVDFDAFKTAVAAL